MDEPDLQFKMGAASAEYFALQALRASSISESSSRAALFFTTITGTLVALGLLSNSLSSSALQWTAVGASPVLAFLGLTSFLRIVETAIEDVAALRAMNRLRRWMTTTAPDLQPLIIVPERPDQPGNEFVSTGAREHPLRIMFTLGSTVGTVNSAQFAVAIALGVERGGAGTATAAAAGLALGSLAVVAHARYQLRRYATAVSAWQTANP